jgi:hypothetical protein
MLETKIVWILQLLYLLAALYIVESNFLFKLSGEI